MRKIDESVFIAEGAHVIRDVVLKKNSSVWFNAVLRGDEDQIIIGEGTNIQDNCVIHCGQGYSTVVGNGVTVGHLALLHAVIGSNCVIGAGSLVTGGTVIPDNSLAMGRPARVVRPVTQKDLDQIRIDAEFYIEQAKTYMSSSY